MNFNKKIVDQIIFYCYICAYAQLLRNYKCQDVKRKDVVDF